MDWIYLSAVVLGIAWVHHREARGGQISTQLALDALVGTLLWTAYLAHDLYSSWAQEDGWVEWATFVAFVTAGTIGCITAWTRRHTVARLDTLAGVAVAAFCLFVAAEEISWGQRLLGFQPPEIFLERNFQQELNVHNLLKGESLLGFPLESRHLIALIALGYGVLLPTLERFLPVPQTGWPARIRQLVTAVAPYSALTPWFAAVALAEIVYPTKLTGEAAELILGVLFAIDALHKRPSRAPLSQPALVALIVASGMLLPTASNWLLFGPDADLTEAARQELLLLKTDIESGGLQPKAEKKRSIHKRVFTAVRVGYVRFGDDSRFQGSSPNDPRPTATRVRTEYFLDPWNNPYWIRYRRENKRGVIYSFGSNRRRDSDFSETLTAGGDDVVVAFTRPP